MKKIFIITICLSLLFIMGFDTYASDNLDFINEIDTIDEDNIIAWFDASEKQFGLIEVWEDKSGNNNNAIAKDSAPQAMEGFIIFEGEGLDIEFEEPYEVPISIFMSFKIEESGSIFDSTDGSDRIRLLKHGGALRVTSSEWSYQASYYDLEIPTELMIGTFAWAGERDNGDWIDDKGNLNRLNGETLVQNDGTVNNLRTLRIGNEHHMGNPFKGAIGEIIIIDSLLDIEDMEIIEQYLTKKWLD